MLRQQLRVLRRQVGRPRFTVLDRVLLAAASRAIPRDRWASFLVTPQTLLRWHRELVRRKWTYHKERKPGRPPIDPTVAGLILRMARENPRWGWVRIAGELRKLGIRVGATTIRALLRRQGLGPAPRRSGPTWTQFLRAQAEAIVACDFFTMETIRLQTLYVLFFIELSTRRTRCWGYGASRLSLGHPAGQERRDGSGGSWAVDQVPTARPRRQVHQFLRRGVPQRGVLRFFERRSGLRRPTPMPSGGCRPCVGSVWTGRWCLGVGICCGSLVPMSATTTSSGRTAAWRWPFPSQGPGKVAIPPLFVRWAHGRGPAPRDRVG